MPQPVRLTDARRVHFYLLLVSLCLLASYLAADASGALSLSVRLGLLLGIVAVSYLSVRLYLGAARRAGTPADPERVLLPLFAVFFALYLHLLLTLTLLDPSLGRDGGFSRPSWEEYFATSVNLRPFYTIVHTYIINGIGADFRFLSPNNILLNLAGNIIAFMPLSFFLPLFWRAMRRWYVFLVTVTLAVAAVEVLQLVFMRGICDVDDLILNAGGAALCYFVLRIPPVSRLLRRLTCGLWEMSPRRKSQTDEA